MLLYFVQYIPQLYHNHKSGKLNHLSLHFHQLLVLSYFADLVYGFGMNMPWQYILVSAIGLSQFLFQHYQLHKIHKESIYFKTCSYGLIFLSISGILLITTPHSAHIFLTAGFIAHFAGQFHAIPQIIRNAKSNAAQALSMSYLGLTFIVVLCDNISAWTLGWPLPSKIGAATNIIFTSILIIQKKMQDQYMAISSI